jgi:hypothetical protein
MPCMHFSQDKGFGIRVFVALSAETPLYVQVVLIPVILYNAAVLQLCVELYLNQQRNTTNIKLKVYSCNTLF